jgi:hypothetical protein
LFPDHQIDLAATRRWSLRSRKSAADCSLLVVAVVQIAALAYGIWLRCRKPSRPVAY